jgi:DNA-directed RNA polymerase specialized sigma24 family protein
LTRPATPAEFVLSRKWKGAATIDTTAPPGDPVRISLEDPAVRVRLLAQARATARRLLASLPEPYRTAVDWKVLHDREYDALAEHLGTSATNARQLVHRGINKL